MIDLLPYFTNPIFEFTFTLSAKLAHGVSTEVRETLNLFFGNDDTGNFFLHLQLYKQIISYISFFGHQNDIQKLCQPQ